MPHVTTFAVFLFVATFAVQIAANDAVSFDEDLDFEDTLALEPQAANLTRRNCWQYEGRQLCHNGDCCQAGTFCLALDTGHTRYTCATDLALVKSRPVSAETAGACEAGWTKCSTGGCCDGSSFCTPSSDGGGAEVCLGPTWPDGVPAGAVAYTTPDANGVCDGEGASLCGSAAGSGCCGAGSGCLPRDSQRTSFVCASARVLAGAASPTEYCLSDSTPCQNLGCCPAGTACQPIDYNQSEFVCASQTVTASFGVAPVQDAPADSPVTRQISIGVLAAAFFFTVSLTS